MKTDRSCLRMRFDGAEYEAVGSWERVGDSYAALSQAEVLLPGTVLEFAPGGQILMGAKVAGFPPFQHAFTAKRIANAVNGNDDDLIAVTFVFAPVPKAAQRKG